MEWVDPTNKIPIKFWLTHLEEGAMQQARNLANFPFAFHHIAIMPDAHQGYGMPIGGVLATENVIIPNAVGVDIGCGMIAQQTEFTGMTEDLLKNILGKIRSKIPVGFAHRDESSELSTPKDICVICKQEYESARHQLGTLGGGNHFIEIQKDKDDRVWIMIHSGSRNLGYKVARYYNNVATQLNLKWESKVPDKWGLAFLPIDEMAGKAYREEMWYAISFAENNRWQMLRDVRDAFKESIFGLSKHPDKYFGEIFTATHNYASLENHFGKNVIVHRKGAIRMRNTDTGIIPGSQGTNSYIVKGLGNKDSFMSASHGAGRVMSRSAARKTLSLEDEKERLGNILHSLRTEKDLDEAPSAYKKIEDVMAYQDDLVEILYELQPLAVVKG